MSLSLSLSLSLTLKSRRRQELALETRQEEQRAVSRVGVEPHPRDKVRVQQGLVWRAGNVEAELEPARRQLRLLLLGDALRARGRLGEIKAGEHERAAALSRDVLERGLAAEVQLPAGERERGVQQRRVDERLVVHPRQDGDDRRRRLGGAARLFVDVQRRREELRVLRRRAEHRAVLQHGRRGRRGLCKVGADGELLHDALAHRQLSRVRRPIRGLCGAAAVRVFLVLCGLAARLLVCQRRGAACAVVVLSGRSRRRFTELPLIPRVRLSLLLAPLLLLLLLLLLCSPTALLLALNLLLDLVERLIVAQSERQTCVLFRADVDEAAAMTVTACACLVIGVADLRLVARMALDLPQLAESVCELALRTITTIPLFRESSAKFGFVELCGHENKI